MVDRIARVDLQRASSVEAPSSQASMSEGLKINADWADRAETHV